MSSILIVYYSLGGNTERVAREIAAQCGGDLEPIREVRTRSRVLGRVRAAWEALTGRRVAIQPAQRDPAAYEVMAIGTPVWAGHVSSPVHAYIAAHREALGRVAFFCTQGGSGAERVFGQMSELCGQEPRDSLVVAERELRGHDYEHRLEAFAGGLADAAGDSPSGSSAAAEHVVARKAG